MQNAVHHTKVEKMNWNTKPISGRHRGIVRHPTISRRQKVFPRVRILSDYSSMGLRLGRNIYQAYITEFKESKKTESLFEKRFRQNIDVCLEKRINPANSEIHSDKLDNKAILVGKNYLGEFAAGIDFTISYSPEKPKIKSWYYATGIIISTRIPEIHIIQFNAEVNGSLLKSMADITDPEDKKEIDSCLEQIIQNKSMQQTNQGTKAMLIGNRYIGEFAAGMNFKRFYFPESMTGKKIEMWYYGSGIIVNQKNPIIHVVHFTTDVDGPLSKSLLNISGEYDEEEIDTHIEERIRIASIEYSQGIGLYP